jgi:hypothetical protein
MPFVFDWATLGTANGSATITDGANSTVLTVASDADIFYSGFLGGNLFVSGITDPAVVTFSTPIKNATFEIYDVDSDGVTYDDQVTILAFDVNGDPVDVIFSDLESYHAQTGNTVEAEGGTSGGVDGSGAEDSITVSFGGPVATIQVIFDHGDDIGRTGAIGIADISGDVVCFADGTLIETARGPVPVESLAIDDMICTMDRGLQPVRWIGHRTVPARGKFAPICIAEGRFGNDRDLRLSPQHRVLLRGWQAELLFGEEEVRVAAKHLLRCDGVWRQPGGEVTYYHLLFDQHEVIFAEGAPCESFHPGRYSMDQIDPDQREELLALFPELAEFTDKANIAARPALKRAEGQLLAALV